MPGFSTKAIHAGQDADPTTGATVVPTGGAEVQSRCWSRSALR